MATNATLAELRAYTRKETQGAKRRLAETDRRIRSLERSIGRATSGLLVIGLLIAGAVLRSSGDPLVTVLMIVAAVPLLHIVIGSRFP